MFCKLFFTKNKIICWIGYEIKIKIIANKNKKINKKETRLYVFKISIFKV